jgi:hypothetical protein
MSVKVRARLPKGDANGLAQWEKQLAEHPDKAIHVVCLIRADTIEERPHDEDDPRIVKCVFLGIEAVDAKAEAAVVDKLLHSVYEARTGKATLPFEDDDL